MPSLTALASDVSCAQNYRDEIRNKVHVFKRQNVVAHSFHLDFFPYGKLDLEMLVKCISFPSDIQCVVSNF